MLGGGGFEVTFECDSAENPGTTHTIILKVKDVSHAPQVFTNIVSLPEIDADGLGYVGKVGAISMFGG